MIADMSDTLPGQVAIPQTNTDMLHMIRNQWYLIYGISKYYFIYYQKCAKEQGHILSLLNITQLGLPSWDYSLPSS